MTGTEGFIQRWSRLKRLPEQPSQSEPSGGETPPGAEDSIGHFSHEGEASPQQGGQQAEPGFDPTTLPSIDSIAVDNDVRMFLQSGVPEDLKRSALRRMWVTDPAICNFIGVAENQWDFTDPEGIPGFGPMRETDDVAALVAHALGRREAIPGGIARVSLSEEFGTAPQPSNLPDAPESDPAEPHLVQAPSDPVEGKIRARIENDEQSLSLGGDDRTRFNQEETPRRRGHGGALPKVGS